ncbi:cytochrome C oxidase subunit II [Flavobacterium akiainvivens]|uniref:cytochrome-c oxidase n=1 Tax=Flavobacterium akiainvivens TaxID=1202724 RepID=A0A0M8MD38_9FLAO|nr:cytochrome c oxidase subunit II [Flavobacterium akiainvivens]KOS07665.1 cytochrome C oxidase subunit II [Flavobacterium akiainvivens]SFQ23808.1 cytochrome c oxidase subunit 2 [Flavobacterium akiainvivens]
MTGLLIFAVIILLGVAIWQLSKIFQLTKIGAAVYNENSEVATDKDNNVNGWLMFAFVAFIYIFTIVGLVKWGHFALGTPASEHGPQYDNLLAISFWIIFTVQFLTQFLLHYFSFKYRGKQGNVAYYYADNDKLEFVWTIIPVIVLAVLILYGLYAWTNIMFVADEDKEDALYVEVYAKQFSWEVRYAGKDGVLGKANVRYIEGVNTMGVDMADPHAADDIPASELHLPKGKRVIFKFRSQDVLHSAYMPHFRAQMNVVPGMVTEFSFIPTLTTAEMREDQKIMNKVAHINDIRSKKSEELVADGKPALEPYTFDYLLLCNKICGPSHYNMQMKIVVDEKADFDKWIADQKTLGTAVKESQEKPAEGGEGAPATDTAAKDTAAAVIPQDTTKPVAQAAQPAAH